MEIQPDPQLPPITSDGLELVNSGMTALVAKRIQEAKPTTRTDVLIIGAGPAGLAAAAELRRRGISALVLERGDSVATSWRRRYDRLRLNTSRWTSTLPGAGYPKAAGLFPSRDDVIGYLEEYAAHNSLEIRFGTLVERADRDDGKWRLTTSAGEMTAPQLVVATGHEHRPVVPAWPGRERFAGRLMHSAEYRNADGIRGLEVLVAGPGSSGMEIAYDLVAGGAARVRVAIRNQPNIILRQSGPMPGDVPASLMYRLPAKIADRQTRLIRRLTIGDLSAHGLVPPETGIMTRLKRDGKAPAILDKQVIDAIRQRQIEIVSAVESLDTTGVVLADGARLEPDVVIAATGYATGLEPLVGHLGVLDARGMPLVHGGPPAAPGLRFIGFQPRPAQIRYMGAEAARAAKQIKKELRS